MYIGLTEEQEALQREVREYYAELLTPETRAELAGGGGVGPAMRRVVSQMGEDGWLGVGWPTEWGGRGFTPVEQFLGSDEQKEFFLPKILKGEIHFCIGCSETGAGIDLAALRTRADRDGD